MRPAATPGRSSQLPFLPRTAKSFTKDASVILGSVSGETEAGPELSIRLLPPPPQCPPLRASHALSSGIPGARARRGVRGGIGFQAGGGAAEQRGIRLGKRALPSCCSPAGVGAVPAGGSGAGGGPGWVWDGADPPSTQGDVQGGQCRGFGLCPLRSIRAPWPGTGTTRVNGTAEGWKCGHSAEVKPRSSARGALHEPSPGMGRDEGSASRGRHGKVPPMELWPIPKAPSGLPGRRSARPEPLPLPLPKPPISRFQPLEGHFIPA